LSEKDKRAMINAYLSIKRGGKKEIFHSALKILIKEE